MPKAKNLTLTKSQAACLIALRHGKDFKTKIAIEAGLDLVKTAAALGALARLGLAEQGETKRWHMSARGKTCRFEMLSVYEKIVGLTDDVCDRYLNSEYRNLARALTGALCRKRPSPVASGRPRTWACSIVYVLGRMNFLSDKSFSPHMTTADLCAAFDVGESTVHAKARAIEKAIVARPFDPQWTLPSLVEKNPLVWMAEVNGLLVDLRDMPREIQEIAFEDGLIPYIPADRESQS